MEISIDGIGNVVGTLAGAEPGPPVMCGSHIDTVRTGGRYDGNLGVLAGLGVAEAVQRAGITTRRPLAVGFFTDEEGARFPPDMLGSLVYTGEMPLEEALDIVGADGAVVGEELDRIGYRGAAPCPSPAPHAFVELHIEQGPILDAEGIVIGAVTGVQGISWTEITVAGQSNHAGTTPMDMRHDAGWAATRIAVFVHELAAEFGPPQVCTVGRVELHPNLVNVVASDAVLTVDMRNTDDALLTEAENRLAAFLEELAAESGTGITWRRLGPVRPGGVRPRHDRPGGAGGGRAGLQPSPAVLGRGPRRPDVRPGVPHLDGVRALLGGHQPQPLRAHRARAPGSGGQRAAPGDAGAGRDRRGLRRAGHGGGHRRRNRGGNGMNAYNDDNAHHPPGEPPRR